MYITVLFHPEWGKAETLYITPKLQLAFTGKLSVREAVDQLLDPVNKLLEKEEVENG